MTRTHFFHTTLVLALLTGGCSDEPAAEAPPADGPATAVEAPSSSEPADSTPSENGTVDVDAQYETPEAVYEAASQAIDQKNYAQLSALMTDASQQMLAGGLIFGSSFMTMNDEVKDKQLKELLSRHNVELDINDAMADELANTDPEAMIQKLTEPIENLPQFIGELMTWMEKENEAAGRALPQLGELGEVTIDGDTAVAEVDSDQGNQPIEFRRVNDSWRIHLPSGPQ